MLELALNYGKGLLLLKDIAKREEISEKYLSQIIIPLKTSGLVNSGRGAHGGYMLAKKPAQTTIREIVEVLEGNLAPLECVRNPGICSRSSICVTRNIWTTLSDKMSAVLNSMTLEDLVKLYKEKEERIHSV